VNVTFKVNRPAGWRRWIYCGFHWYLRYCQLCCIAFRRVSWSIQLL